MSSEWKAPVFPVVERSQQIPAEELVGFCEGTMNGVVGASGWRPRGDTVADIADVICEFIKKNVHSSVAFRHLTVNDSGDGLVISVWEDSPLSPEKQRKQDEIDLKAAAVGGQE